MSQRRIDHRKWTLCATSVAATAALALGSGSGCSSREDPHGTSWSEARSVAALKRRFVGGLERARVEARRCEEEGELLSIEQERCFERNVRPVFSAAFRRASADVRALEGRVGQDCRRALGAARYSLRTQGLASPFGDLRSAEHECRREADMAAPWTLSAPAPTGEEGFEISLAAS